MLDRDLNTADFLDVSSFFAHVLFMLEIKPLHYRDYSLVLLNVVGAVDMIVIRNTVTDEIYVLFFLGFGVDDGVAIAVSFDYLLVESGVVRFSLPDFFFG